MKKPLMLSLLAAAGGIAAFALRLLQNRTGFEPATGLPIPGAPAGIILMVWLALLAVLFLFTVRRLYPGGADVLSLPEDFLCRDTTRLMLPLAGSLLMGLSGAADLYEGLGMGNLLFRLRTAADPNAAFSGALTIPEGGFAPSYQLVLGILGLISAAGLASAVLSCRADRGTASQKGTSLLLAAPIYLIVRLVLTYRMASVDPTLEAYYVELLALVFLTLGFYRLSAFAFQSGKLRPYAFYTCMAVVLCLAALADTGIHLSSPLLYAGGAVTLAGFLLQVRFEH